MRVPDGSSFRTGAKLTHPWWKIQGRWFAESERECVIGQGLAARLRRVAVLRLSGTLIAACQCIDEFGMDGEPPGPSIPLVVTVIVSTGDAEDNAVLVSAALAQEMAGQPGKFRQPVR